MTLLPIEVQGYIRHVLHTIGMMIVAYGGYSESTMEMWVGASVNAISLIWFLYISYRNWRKSKEENSATCNCATEFCECNPEEVYEEG